jgi:hypothetical protein
VPGSSGYGRRKIQGEQRRPESHFVPEVRADRAPREADPVTERGHPTLAEHPAGGVAARSAQPSWPVRPRHGQAEGVQLVQHVAEAGHEAVEPAGLAIGRGGRGGSRRSRPVRLWPAAHARHAGAPPSPAGLAIGRGGPGGSRRSRPVRARPGSPLGAAAPEEVGDLGPCGSGPRHMPGMLRNGCVAPGCSRRRKPASAAGRDDRPPDGRRRRPGSKWSRGCFDGPSRSASAAATGHAIRSQGRRRSAAAR